MVADIEDDVLLGADVLQKDTEGPVNIILSEDWMLFRVHNILLHQVIRTDHTPTRKVRLAEDCRIPWMSEVEVVVTEIQDSREWMRITC